MTQASSSSQPTQASSSNQQHITEDEASLYDRQIRLWGLEAQNRMRSSTVLVLSLRSLAHETIKNLVLAGIGRLIVMDDGVVTEEDLGGGFLFHEEDGAVGKERVTAASPQISSLNPLVTLTSLPTLAPFIRDETAAAKVNQHVEIKEFLQREKIDVVIACDMSVTQLETIDDAARDAGVLFYGAGTYGFCGYVFADLGDKYDYVITPPSTQDDSAPSLAKKTLSYPSLKKVTNASSWTLPHSDAVKGGSPYRGVTRNATKSLTPHVNIGILAVWDFGRRHSRLPAGSEDKDEFVATVMRLRDDLGVNPKSYSDPAASQLYDDLAEHLAEHASRQFPPTLAILGGLLAQDVLRALSRKDKPIVNLLAVDSMGGMGTVGKWAIAEARDA